MPAFMRIFYCYNTFYNENVKFIRGCFDARYQNCTIYGYQNYFISLYINGIAIIFYIKF